MIIANTRDNLFIPHAGIKTGRLFFGGILLAFLLYPLISWFMVSSGLVYAWQLISSRVLIWTALVLVYLYARYVEKQKFLLWAEQQHTFIFYLLSVIVLYFICMAAGIVARIPFWLGLHEGNAKLLKMVKVMKQYPVMVFFTSITAAITEELIFRGYMISRLSLFFKNRYMPVILAAILFCAEHLTYKSLQEIIFTLLIGLILGFHYQKYRNIKITIAVHFLIDFITLFAFVMEK